MILCEEIGPAFMQTLFLWPPLADELRTIYRF